MAESVVDIAVVCHNSVEQIEVLIHSLWSSTAEVKAANLLYVIDSGSTDAGALSNIPAKKVLVTENYGFGTCANIVIAACHAPVVALLNPDTTTSFDELEVAAERFLGMGVPVGGVTINDANGRRLANPFLAPRNRLALVFRGRTARNYWSLSGSALLINRALFNSVGGFDSSFFLYGEEIDLCSRLIDLGYPLPVLEECVVVHFSEAGSSGVDPEWRLAQRARGKFLYHRKRHGAVTAWIALGADVARFLIRGALHKDKVLAFLRLVATDARADLPWPPSVTTMRTS